MATSHDKSLEFDALRSGARQALERTKEVFETLSKERWPEEYQELKTSLGQWQVAFLTKSIADLEICSSNRGLYRISQEMRIYSRDALEVKEKLAVFFEYNEEHGCDVLRDEFEWGASVWYLEECAYRLVRSISEIEKMVNQIILSAEESKNPFDLPLHFEIFRIKQIEEAARNQGFIGNRNGLYHQLKKFKHGANWRGQETEKIELDRAELEEFLRSLVVVKFSRLV